MNKENLIPISYVKQFTPLVNGDMVRFSISEGVVTEPWDEQDTLKYHSNPASYDDVYVVSFADRPNTGKQPVGDDVMIDLNMNHGGDFVDVKASTFDWSLDNINHVVTWKLNHAAMLKQYQSEQGVNEMYTKQNTAAATAAKIWPSANSEAPYIFKFLDCSGDTPMWLRDGKWEKFFIPLGEPNDNSVNFLHRPEHEQEAAHTDGQGVVTYAFSYALDHLTKKATHYNCENRTFYRLMSGEFAQVLTDLDWIVSDCTTNSELIHNIKGEFWSLNGTFANRSDEVATVDGKRVEPTSEQQENMGPGVSVSDSELTEFCAKLGVDGVASYKSTCEPQLGKPPLQVGDTIETNDGATLEKTGDNTFLCIKSGDKPVFTQAGARPPAGCRAIHIDEMNEVEILYSSPSFIIFKGEDGKEWNGGQNSFKPIDNRTENERLRDAIIKDVRGGGWNDLEYLCDKLLSSDKFTITLNKE